MISVKDLNMQDAMVETVSKMVSVAINQPELGTAQAVVVIGLLLQEIANHRNRLTQAAAWFRQYESHHISKGDTEKAFRNKERAEFCETASKGV